MFTMFIVSNVCVCIYIYMYIYIYIIYIYIICWDVLVLRADDIHSLLTSVTLRFSWRWFSLAILFQNSCSAICKVRCRRLQHIQNTLAWIVMKVPYDQIHNVITKHLLSTLHWLSNRFQNCYSNLQTIVDWSAILSSM